MPIVSSNVPLHTAGRVAWGGAAALIGVHVARSLHDRWRRLGMPSRDRLEPLAEDVRQRALDLRGEGDGLAAGAGLHEASSRLAAALVGSAERDPELSEKDVTKLRDELSRELDRLAEADPTVSRESGSQPVASDASPSPQG